MLRDHRAVPPVRAHAEPASAVGALAGVINDSIAVLVTHPHPIGPPQAVVLRGHAEPAVQAAGSRGRSSRAMESVSALQYVTAPNGDDQVVDAGTGGDIEKEHVETWRLVRLAQDGDGEAFGLLYDRYIDTVFRFIYYRVNDRALAEDFASETFVRALRRIATITYQGRDIGAWFITIARNIVLDHVKSARHRLEVTTADTFEGRERVQSTENAVLETLDSERLMQAVGQLGDEQRECVLLRFMQGLSVNETATIMGKNDGAIKALQHRAVRKLADLIGDELR